MPTYNYKCEKCNKEFEVVRRISETTDKCKHCKSKKIKQVITAGNFILKGDGWFNKGGY